MEKIINFHLGLWKSLLPQKINDDLFSPDIVFDNHNMAEIDKARLARIELLVEGDLREQCLVADVTASIEKSTGWQDDNKIIANRTTLLTFVI